VNPRPRLPPPPSPELARSAEKAKIQAFLDDRYTAADVKHSYLTRAGETVDCIDFFAYPSVKMLAKRGTPITSIPQPPHPPHVASPTPSPPSTPDIDANGALRFCSNTTVPILRVTSDQILAAGGLEPYLARKPSTQVRPPRPRPVSGAVLPMSSSASTPSAGTAQAQVASGHANPFISPGPDAGSAPYCTEFEQTDLPQYAHVQSTIYPGGSTSISGGEGTMSINKTGLNTTQLNHSDHSLLQLWMYSGWAFNSPAFPSCTCSLSDPNRPCTQSVEVGVTNFDLDNSSNTENFFIFSTNNGYFTDCWAGSPGNGCTGGDVSLWIPATGASMTGQMSLNSEIEFESGTGWWVESGVNEVTPSSSTTIYTTTWQGYFTSGSFSGGAMASGNAQTFQAGGEVYDFEQGQGDGWTVPMGTGSNPSVGYPSAAYVRNASAVSVPTTIGPVTVPAQYTYSTTAAEGGSWGNYFYVGGPGAPDGYTWSKYATPQNSTPPTLWVPSRTRGVNAVTIAPVYFYDATIEESELNIYVLTATASGNNHLVEKYSSLSNTWSDVKDTNGNDVYVWGVTTDGTNGAFWGWTHFTGTTGGNVWTNDSATGISEQSGWPGFTSVATVGPNSVYATNLTGIEFNAYHVEFGYMPGGNWTNSEASGDQITADSITGELYILSTSGTLYIDFGGNEIFLADTLCAGGDVTFVQIAAKNATLYGLTGSGTVYYYPNANSNNMSGCWTPVGTKTGFAYSIATDNGDLTAVWASDGSGAMWTAE